MHRFGTFSTALQNICFVFDGFAKVDPLEIDNSKILRICHPKVSREGTLFHEQSNHYLPDDGLSFLEIRSKINSFIANNDPSSLYIIDGFPNLFSDMPHLYSKISRGRQVVVNQGLFNNNLLFSPTVDKPHDFLNIAVHIRRGDISQTNNSYAFLPVSYFNNVVLDLSRKLKEKSIKFSITVHCEGSLDGLNFDHDLLCEINPIRSFIQLCQSDIVISSYSSHSSVPPILSGGLCIYPENTWIVKLPYWVSASLTDGKIDMNKFSNWLKYNYGTES